MGDGDAMDMGHILFVRETPMHLGIVSCRGTKYHRYKMKVADASRKMHFGHGSTKDTRAKCFEDSATYGTVPKNNDMTKLGCGVGEGWIYAWAKTCPFFRGCRTTESKRHEIHAVRLFPKSDKQDGLTTCPPRRNLRCHSHRIGRLTRK